jgi:hypothetical protein
MNASGEYKKNCIIVPVIISEELMCYFITKKNKRPENELF